MRSLLAGAALIALMAAPAAAQNTEVSGGFALQTWNGCCAYGFGADFAQAVKSSTTSSIAIVADFGWTKFSSTAEFPDSETDTSFVGGVRFKAFRDKPVSVFVQGTTGVMHWSEDFSGFAGASGDDFIVGGGGGVQIRLTKVIDIKAQVDIWGAKNPDLEGWHRITRLLFGAVFKFGAK